MDDLLAAQLVRQLKILNIWITIFGSLILAVLFILGFLVFKVVSFVNDTNKKIETISSQAKQSLDIKSQICNTNTVGGFLQDKTGVCSK